MTKLNAVVAKNLQAKVATGTRNCVSDSCAVCRAAAYSSRGTLGRRAAVVREVDENTAPVNIRTGASDSAQESKQDTTCSEQVFTGSEWVGAAARAGHSGRSSLVFAKALSEQSSCPGGRVV